MPIQGRFTLHLMVFMWALIPLQAWEDEGSTHELNKSPAFGSNKVLLI
jgi:hypothetical protein